LRETLGFDARELTPTVVLGITVLAAETRSFERAEKTTRRPVHSPPQSPYASRSKMQELTCTRHLQEDPLAWMRTFFERAECFVAFAADPSVIALPDQTSDLNIVRLSTEQIADLARRFPEVDRDVQRIRTHGFNDAWGVFKGHELSHVSWLISAKHDRRLPVRNVKLRRGEAEITHALTRFPFRGQGIFPLAIRSLCQIAAARGVRQVFLITGVNNTSSRRAIEKAGIRQRGEIIRHVLLPRIQNRWSITDRGHRS
jgi:RimJ/RimL family protein N-acetyltransferase